MVQIINFEEQYKDDFRRINYEWITSMFEVTTMDEQAFSDPKKYILDRGGYIYLAQIGNEIVGSVALERLTKHEYALTRMGVNPAYQGQKIGQKLMDAALKQSKSLKVSSVVLYTNEKLVNALNLYIKNGFRFVPLDEVAYKRATIKMELKF